jgi:hypothetical protein
MGCLSGGGAKMEDHLPRVSQISRFVFTRYESDSNSQNLAGTVHMIARENMAKARSEEVITRLLVIDSSNFISERGK